MSCGELHRFVRPIEQAPVCVAPGQQGDSGRPDRVGGFGPCTTFLGPLGRLLNESGNSVQLAVLRSWARGDALASIACLGGLAMGRL